MLISVEEIDKNHLQPGQEIMGDAPVLSHCRLVRYPWPKPTGVLEHCQGGTNYFSPLFRVFPSDHIPKATNDVNLHFFIHLFTISVNYTSELSLILRRSRTGTVWFYTSTSNKRAARPKLYTKSLTRDLKLMYSRLTLVRISINLQAPRFFYIGTGVSLLFRERFLYI